MDKNSLFTIGLIALALIVIATGIWVFFSPPLNDEPQAVALVAIGVFMVLIGYDIAQRNKGGAC
jgi:hypothetical membrane protein